MRKPRQVQSLADAGRTQRDKNTECVAPGLNAPILDDPERIGELIELISDLDDVPLTFRAQVIRFQSNSDNLEQPSIGSTRSTMGQGCSRGLSR